MRIAFLGDSLTEGHPGESYLARLRRLLPGDELRNGGRGGDTVPALLARLEHTGLEPADLALVWIGVNDAFLGDWYLPDFWLPGINTWLEVKGPGVPGLGKFEEFAREQGPRGVAFPPDEWEARGCEGYETHVGMAFVVGTTPRRDGELDVPSWQQACRYCGEWLPIYHDNLPEGCSFLAWCTTGTCIGQSQFVTRHGGICGCGMDRRCFVCGDKVSPRLTGVEFARLPRIEPAGRRS